MDSRHLAVGELEEFLGGGQELGESRPGRPGCCSCAHLRGGSTVDLMQSYSLPHPDAIQSTIHPYTDQIIVFPDLVFLVANLQMLLAQQQHPDVQTEFSNFLFNFSQIPKT